MNPISFIVGIFDRIRMGIGMLLPIFADAADFKNWNPWVRRGIHLLLLGLVLFGLYYLQSRWTGLERYLKVRPNPELRPYYLCLAFLLLYALCWVGYALLRFFATPEEVSDFPDIERAWATAVRELDRAGVRINDPDNAVPVFLVLGRPSGGMDALFRAAGWNFQIRSPADPEARVVVYACYDPYAVFVTAPAATGWSYLCAALDGDTRFAPAAGSPEAADPTKTLSFDAEGGLQQYGLSASEGHELRSLLRVQSKRDLAEAQQERLKILSDKGKRGGGGGQPFSIRTEVLRTGERELQFLCSLIRRDRWPLCPVNGALVLVPWGAGETDGVAQVAARELAANLAVARATFQLHYPTIAAVCDLEWARGFAQFREGFSAEQRKARIGQRLPLVPARVEGGPEPTTLIRRAIQWIGHAIVPVWVLGAVRVDPTAARPAGQDPNRDLYLLLREVHRRVPRFAAILGRVPAGGEQDAGDGEELGALPLFGGCYLTGTGTRPSGQAFVTGVFQRLIDDQAAVAWTRRAYAEDARYRRMSAAGYAVIAVVLAAVVVAAVLGG